MSTQYHVYGNGGSGGPIDYSTVVATVSTTSWSSSALALSSSWRFAVRAFDTGTTLEEQNVDAAVDINLDSAGHDLALRPQAPRLVTLTPTASGGMAVDWACPCPVPRPTGFHVYAGVGSPSYSSPAATVSWADRPCFRTQLSGYANGNVVAVTVRAYNAGGEEPNTLVATAVALASTTVTLDAITVSATSGGVVGTMMGDP